MAIIEQEKRIERYDGDNVLESVEVQKSTSKFRKSSEEGEFFKVYFKSINILQALPENGLKLLIMMAGESSYANSDDSNNFGGQIVSARKDVKKRWAYELNISERALYTNLKLLVDRECVRKIDAQTYQINPYVIGRGLQSYSPSRGFGGIVELRNNFDAGVLNARTDTTSDALVKESLDDEISSLYMKKKTASYQESGAIDKQIKSLQYEASKVDEDGYTMNTEYKQIKGGYKHE